jgi:hypothetical protein
MATGESCRHHRKALQQQCCSAFMLEQALGACPLASALRGLQGAWSLVASAASGAVRHST